MKTKRIRVQKMSKFFILALVIIGMQSCETEIPIEDDIPPKFSFRVTGDGFDHTFNQDTNFNSIRLMLRRGVTYDFVYAGSDEGGMDRIEWNAIHLGRVSIDPPTGGPWIYSHLAGSYSSLHWNGDRNNPVTGSAVAGSFTTQGSGNDATFRFTLEDFGGEVRVPNNILKDLTIYIGAHNTRIQDL